MLDLTLCNELLDAEGLTLAEQARIAHSLGYVGLELAPSTLGPTPHLLAVDEIDAIRQTVEGGGVTVSGLHWLLSGYPDASITDPERCNETRAILLGLIGLCARLGGRVLVHGSPGQRVAPAGLSADHLRDRLAEFFAPIARAAEQAGVIYCIEPLSTRETDTITTVAEGAALVDAVGSPAFRTMIDCKAAGTDEPPVAALIRKWVPTGAIGHIHMNDTNLGAPGMGDDPFPQIVKALLDVGWLPPVGVEPFRTLIDAKVTAAIGIATLRACAGAAS